MIIQCNSCSRKFIVRDTDIPKTGRMVKCGYCSETWHQMPELKPSQEIKKPKKIKTLSKIEKTEDSPSIDNIKASDGKNYRFLGSQWAEVLPSGKTGLFARKKIGKELDEITGRKEKKIYKKKKKKIEEVDPSQSLKSSKQLPDVYQPKKGIGFFNFIFLAIIIAFSIVGILKTFENDIVSALPEMENIYTLLDEQLEYVSESVKNITVIVNDLIDSY
tara:strand:- start:413 stop:1066 length:654 start_codon:yes stop_codon:yes gene_type:complete